MPVKGASNTAVTYNSINITAYLNQGDLDAAIAQLDVTNLASTGKEFLPEPTEWSISFNGFWDVTLDSALAPDIITPVAAGRQGAIAFTDDGGQIVTYSWASGARIENYKVSSGATAVIANQTKLRMSGAPTRTVT